MNRRNFLQSLGAIAGSMALPIPLPGTAPLAVSWVKVKPITKADVQRVMDRMMKVQQPKYVMWNVHPEAARLLNADVAYRETMVPINWSKL